MLEMFFVHVLHTIEHSHDSSTSNPESSWSCLVLSLIHGWANREKEKGKGAEKRPREFADMLSLASYVHRPDINMWRFFQHHFSFRTAVQDEGWQLFHESWQSQLTKSSSQIGQCGLLPKRTFRKDNLKSSIIFENFVLVMDDLSKATWGVSGLLIPNPWYVLWYQPK